MIGSMLIAAGHVVIFRTEDTTSYNVKGPRVGIVIRDTDDGKVIVRVACGQRRYCLKPLTIPKALVARDATDREAYLGYPVDPVPPRPPAASPKEGGTT